MRRIAGGLVGALALAAPAAAGADPVTPDGQAIAYSTNVSHLSRDGDTFFDVYLWNRGAFSLASPGPDTTGRGMVPVFISTDGSRVVFTTDSAMVPQDVDTTYDVYESTAGGPVQLMSTGPDDAPEGGVGARYAGASADGSRVFFMTTVPLVPEDTDDQLDIYQRTTAGVTTLVSTSRPGTAPGYHVLSGLSSDGSRVIEQTDEALTPQDTDTAPDIYERAGGTVTLLSQGPTSDATPDPGGAEVRGVTPDARSVVFATKDRLTAGDQNDDLDLYQRRAGQTLLVTARSDGTSPPCRPTLPTDDTRAPAPCTPDFYGQSDDGSKVLFSSDKPLAEGPDPNGLPITVMRGGLLTRTASGTQWIDDTPATATMAADGSRFIIGTRSSHAAEDTDGEFDLYSLQDGAWRLLTPRTAQGVDQGMISRDARRVVFDTTEPLVARDTDSSKDLYTNTDTGPALLSTGPADKLAQPSNPGALGMSADGSRVFFSSMTPMVAADTDSERDLYLWTGGRTTLLSP